MKWDFWKQLYLERHCTARGLRTSSIKAYRDDIDRFRRYVLFRLDDRGPDELTARDLLEYVDYLRRECHNGAARINRQVTVLRYFYRAIVAMGYLDADQNPMAHFPTIKAAPTKLPIFLNEEEVTRLVEHPRTDTVLGRRDRAILILLYGTGIRATECATLKEGDVDLQDQSIRVIGKGGHERTVPLSDKVVQALRQYRMVRGTVTPMSAFFRSRHGGAMSRNAIYERVRTHGRKAHIRKPVSPHRLRHTFATHMVRQGEKVTVVQELLGHRCISSTQIYLHTTAQDLREAAERHPVERLIARVEELLPNVKLPFQWPPGEKLVGRVS